LEERLDDFMGMYYALMEYKQPENIIFSPGRILST
jgi:hypothetical protein